jgi:hypothetical protein
MILTLLGTLVLIYAISVIYRAGVLSGYWLQSEQRYLTKMEVALAGSRRGSDRIAGSTGPSVLTYTKTLGISRGFQSRIDNAEEKDSKV